jgi:hypothetical protein
MANTQLALTGGCQCGRVRYAASGTPDDVSVCHCRMCQKAVGGPFIALAMFRPEQVTWTRGEPASFRSSTIATRLYCADCGTPLAFVDDDTGNIELTLGSLDNPDRLPPIRAAGIESRVGWVDAVPSLPALSTQQNYEGQGKRHIVSFQHPDHDTPAGWTPPRGVS